MARISTYVIDGTIVDGDKVIGSDANNDMVTKNYTIGDLVAYFAVSIGDYLVPYNNATDNVDLGTFTISASSLYLSDGVFLNGSPGVSGEALVSQGPGLPAVWSAIIGSQNLSNVLNNGNLGSKSIILENASSRIVSDIEAIHGTSANVYVKNRSTNDVGQFFSNKTTVQEAALQKAAAYLSNKIEYTETVFGNKVTIIPGAFNNQTFVYPNVGGAFVMSVNGTFADLSGNVTIPVGPGGGTLLALPFTTDHLASTNNPYVIGDVVYYLGDVYRCIANNDSILPTSPIYWTNLGAGFPLVQQPSDWNSTSGNNQILNKPTIPTGTVTSIATSGLISGGTITTSGTIGTSMNTNKLVGRSTAGVGEMEEITIGTGLSLSAGTLNSTAAGILHGTASGTDTYTVTIAGATAYADGDAYLIRFTNGNTTGATLNINGQGAVSLYRNNDGAVIGGDIISGAEMLCVYNSSSNHFQVIGVAPNTLIAYVTNADSVAITKGQVVYAFGGQGDRLTVKLASNIGDSTSAQTIGVVLSTSIGVNQRGFIINQGLLDGLNILPTSTYADGDPLFLGATAGSITNTKPYAPNHLVYLGNVTNASNGAAGRWYVRVQNGYELDELHNVQARTPTLKDTLWYDNTVSPAQWKTASISTILGYTPVNPTRNIGTTAPLAGGGDLSADRTLSITQATASTDGYVSSTDWNTFNNKLPSDATLLGYNGLGSTIKGYPLGINLTAVGGSLAFSNQRLHLVPVYVGADQSVIGVKWYQFTIGTYTANNYNGVGLYSISGGTLTLIASSTNDGNVWKAATSTWGSKAFSAPQSISRGTYYIGALINATAAPSGAFGVVTIGPATLTGFDFTASRMYCYLAGQLTLPASVTLSSTVSLGTAGLYFSLY